MQKVLALLSVWLFFLKLKPFVVLRSGWPKLSSWTQFKLHIRSWNCIKLNATQNESVLLIYFPSVSYSSYKSILNQFFIFQKIYFLPKTAKHNGELQALQHDEWLEEVQKQIAICSEYLMKEKRKLFTKYRARKQPTTTTTNLLIFFFSCHRLWRFYHWCPCNKRVAGTYSESCPFADTQ